MVPLCLPCRVPSGAASCKSPRRRILVLGTSGAHWPARWPRFGGTKRLLKMYCTYYQIVAFLKCRQVICTKTIITLPDAPSSSSSTALPAPSTKSAFLCACGRIGNRVPASGCNCATAWPDVGVGCRHLVVIGLPPVINSPINNTGAGGRFGVAGRGLFLIVGIMV